MEIKKMVNSLGKVEIPFAINFVSKRGNEKVVESTNVLDVLILNGIVNLGMINLKSKNTSTKNNIEIEIGSIHSGKYLVSLTLDEFACLYNKYKEIKQKNEEQIQVEM